MSLSLTNPNIISDYCECLGRRFGFCVANHRYISSRQNIRTVYYIIWNSYTLHQFIATTRIVYSIVQETHWIVVQFICGRLRARFPCSFPHNRFSRPFPDQLRVNLPYMLLKIFVVQRRFELRTSWLSVKRSNQLSYWTIWAHGGIRTHEPFGLLLQSNTFDHSATCAYIYIYIYIYIKHSVNPKIVQ